MWVQQVTNTVTKVTAIVELMAACASLRSALKPHPCILGKENIILWSHSTLPRTAHPNGYVNGRTSTSDPKNSP